MQPIDWSAIEARQGPISQERRALIEMQLLADDSQRLLTRADQVERWGAAERETVADAHAEGKTVEQYENDRQDAMRDSDDEPAPAAGPDTANRPHVRYPDGVVVFADGEWYDPVDRTPYESGRDDLLHGRVDPVSMDDPEFSAEYRRGRQEATEQLGKVEDQIRQTYRQVAGDRNRLVTLAELRAALPAELSREQVDAALTNLRDHADVHMSPRTEQRNASPENQAAALAVGGSHDHQLSIDYTQDPERVAERLHSRDEGRATSMVAALSDSTVLEVAREMGVPASDDVQQVRADLVATSVANRDAWLADARQGAADGTLLYRADTEPQWAASLNSDERQELAAAAARLQQRADTEPAWAYVKDRADRWVNPGNNPTPQREADGASRERETDSPSQERDTAGELDDPDARGYEAAVDYSGPGGDFDLQPMSAVENMHPETKAFEDLTPADRAYLAEKYPAEWGRDAYDDGIDDELSRLASGGMTAGDMERDDVESSQPTPQWVQEAEARYEAELRAEEAAQQTPVTERDLAGEPEGPQAPGAERYDLTQIEYSEDGFAGIPAEWDLNELLAHPDIELVEVPVPPEERAQMLAEIASHLSPQEFAELAERSMVDPAERVPPPWEVNELVNHDDPEREVAELAEQLRTEREDVYGDRAADVRAELDWRATTTGDPEAENVATVETPDRADAGERAETAEPDGATSIGPELRAARTYLEQRTERESAPREPAERDTGAAQEQAHRESARVMSERQQAEPQRGIEREAP